TAAAAVSAPPATTALPAHRRAGLPAGPRARGGLAGGAMERARDDRQARSRRRRLALVAHPLRELLPASRHDTGRDRRGSDGRAPPAAAAHAPRGRRLRGRLPPP